MTKSNIEAIPGVLGGGQLGKMLAQAAADLNLRISVLDPTLPLSPASCLRSTGGGDFKITMIWCVLVRITHHYDRNRNVNLDALIDLQTEGKQVYPWS